MGLIKKKNKVQKEPQYKTSLTNTECLNYKVFYLTRIQELTFRLLGFVAGALIFILFYGGIGKDVDGNPTMLTHILNVIFFLTGGIVGVKVFMPIIKDILFDRRKKDLRKQFRDLLDSLNASIGAGKNVPDSFSSAMMDLKIQYDANAYIIKELEIIISGLNNNIAIEALLKDFGERSGIDDILSFARVFEISYRRGANMKDIIAKTHKIISDKMETEEEIQTVISSSKMESYIMLVMPILMILLIKTMSPDIAANFTTGVGIVSTSIAVVLFVVSYFIARKMMDIKL